MTLEVGLQVHIILNGSVIEHACMINMEHYEATAMDDTTESPPTDPLNQPIQGANAKSITTARQHVIPIPFVIYYFHYIHCHLYTPIDFHLSVPMKIFHGITKVVINLQLGTIKALPSEK